MNLPKFLAYAVLACWISLTAVVVGTALQWSAARGISQVKIQRALTAQKEAGSNVPSNAQLDLQATPEERAEVAHFSGTMTGLSSKQRMPAKPWRTRSISRWLRAISFGGNSESGVV